MKLVTGSETADISIKDYDGTLPDAITELCKALSDDCTSFTLTFTPTEVRQMESTYATYLAKGVSLISIIRNIVNECLENDHSKTARGQGFMDSIPLTDLGFSCIPKNI